MGNKIKAAGGVVIQGRKILFIKKNGRWDMPKGKLKKGANRKKTAMREICEETGLKKKDLKLLQLLMPTYHHIKVKGSINIKRDFLVSGTIYRFPKSETDTGSEGRHHQMQMV